MGDDVYGLAAMLEALGPFASALVLPSSRGPGDGWLPVPALRDHDVVAGRVQRVRDALGVRAPAGREVGPRVAGATMHLGLVARLLAVEVSARTLAGASVDWEEAWWQDVLGGPVPIAIHRPLGGEAAVPAPVCEFTQLVDAAYGLGPHVAWGNVASGVNSAAVLFGAACPEFASRALAVADEMLADPRLEGGVLRAGKGFRRRSCCLVHQVSGDSRAVCGDCVLGGR